MSLKDIIYCHKNTSEWIELTQKSGLDAIIDARRLVKLLETSSLDMKRLDVTNDYDHLYFKPEDHLITVYSTALTNAYDLIILVRDEVETKLNYLPHHFALDMHNICLQDEKIAALSAGNVIQCDEARKISAWLHRYLEHFSF